MLLTLFVTATFAQQITIHVETAGTLSSMIAESKKNSITDLKLTGHLNTKDFAYIQGMRAIENLDMKDAIAYDTMENPGIIHFASFENMTKLKHVILPAKTIEIGPMAFRNCSSLETVEFPDVLEKIEESAFYNCINLISLNLPNTLKTIGCGSFRGCESLKSIIIPNSVVSLGTTYFPYSDSGGCFQGCTSLEEIILSENITSIPSNFMFGCENVKSIIIPDEVHTIGNYAFAGCINIKDFVVGEKVSFIYPFYNNIENLVLKCQNVGSQWFRQSNALKTIVFEKTVQSIESGAFYGLVNLESIHIPKNITTIGEAAFKGCIGVKTFTVDENNPNYSSLNNAFLNKDQTTLIYFANGSSENFTISETVTKIEEAAFYNCDNLKSLKIPASVTEIGNSALYGCKKLKEIYSYATTPPSVQDYTFNNIDKWLCTLYVPVGSYSAYWIAPGWGDFINIEEYDPTGIQTVTEEENNENHYYSIDGRELTSPQTGINIVKSKNGKTKKIFIK